MFLRLGGLAWELNIGPKRLQERIRNDFEEEKAITREKNTIIGSKKRHTETPKHVCALRKSRSIDPACISEPHRGGRVIRVGGCSGLFRYEPDPQEAPCIKYLRILRYND